eukprot:TRINITY_DN11500_c0_g1_i1.p1 TRINITY_DN11500_c0_g1~~TRINITY_DN11500_c0_g1_i1.p1  ORF type:complete len:806 (-),score=208.03 TRINITY_DN11500_c0_g1_i1:1168-3585(-)
MDEWGWSEEDSGSFDSYLSDTYEEIDGELQYEDSSSGEILMGDDSSDDLTRKTKKEKKFEDLERQVKKVKNRATIEDWGEVLAEFTNLQSLITKTLKKQFQNEKFPGFFIQFISDLEEDIQVFFDSGKRGKNAKAFKTLRQKFKKYLKENEAIRDHVELYREDPDDYLEEESSDSLSGGLIEDKYDKVKDDSEEVHYTERPITYWYEYSEDKGQKRQRRVRVKGEKANENSSSEEDSKDDEKKKITWDSDQIDKTVAKYIKLRGSKRYDRYHTIAIFNFLLLKAKGLERRIQIIFYMLNVQLDVSRKLETFMWISAFNNLVKLVNTFLENPELDLVEGVSEKTDVIKGNFLASFQKLSNLLYETLRNSEPHSKKYMDYLGYEVDLVLLAKHIENYYLSKGLNKKAANMAYFQLHHIHYKNTIPDFKQAAERGLIADENRIEDTPPAETFIIEGYKGELQTLDRTIEVEEVIPPIIDYYESLEEAVEVLSSKVYKNGDDRFKQKAAFYQIFHLALNNKYYEARDIMLMSHIPEKVHRSSKKLQILYNRCLVQIGIAAFRNGYFKDCQYFITDPFSSSVKAKELLGQALTKSYEGKEDLSERGRQYPLHMHIPYDLIEVVYYTVCMILETGTKKRNPSRNWKKTVEYYNRSIFSGPPESVKDTLVVASKKLLNGDWKTANDLITGLDVWTFVEDNEHILSVLLVKLKEIALRSYLKVNAEYFVSTSLSNLKENFGLPEPTIKGIISKLIINNELEAGLEMDSDYISFYAAPTSKTFATASTFVDRANVLFDVEDNNRERRQSKSKRK